MVNLQPSRKFCDDRERIHRSNGQRSISWRCRKGYCTGECRDDEETRPRFWWYYRILGKKESRCSCLAGVSRGYRVDAILRYRWEYSWQSEHRASMKKLGLENPSQNMLKGRNPTYTANPPCGRRTGTITFPARTSGVWRPDTADRCDRKFHHLGDCQSPS